MCSILQWGYFELLCERFYIKSYECSVFLHICASTEYQSDKNLILIYSFLLLVLSIVFSYCVSHLYLFCELYCFFSMFILHLFIFLHLSLLELSRSCHVIVEAFSQFSVCFLIHLHCSLLIPFASDTALSSSVILPSFSSNLSLSCVPT